MNQNMLWYKDAVFYRVSVQAFKDSQGDSHGDLRGLTAELDYKHKLGNVASELADSLSPSSTLQHYFPLWLKHDGN
jgi:hypothetical protein